MSNLLWDFGFLCGPFEDSSLVGHGRVYAIIDVPYKASEKSTVCSTGSLRKASKFFDYLKDGGKTCSCEPCYTASYSGML
jgi:hypothetical protein